MKKSLSPSEIESLAKEVIHSEAEAVRSLESRIDENFIKVINLILDMNRSGKVVVSGMGKSGFIGMKISATFASVGVPSFFLHPAEAVHGDLGRYSDADVALLLSNSGETQEIIELLPFLKKSQTPIVAITSSSDSTLGRTAHHVLALGDMKEAGPLGLAPTTSTTATLALGDALAMVLQEMKGLSREQFADFHPAGSLGRSLLTVSDIMRTGDEICTVSKETLCRDVLHAITNTIGRPGAAIIVEDNTLIGIFTDGDLRRCLDHNPDFLKDPVSEHMGLDPKTVAAGTLVSDATNFMSESRIDQLIVINQENQPIGLVDIQDAVSVRMR